jgi:hypothetical protein
VRINVHHQHHTHPIQFAILPAHIRSNPIAESTDQADPSISSLISIIHTSPFPSSQSSFPYYGPTTLVTPSHKHQLTLINTHLSSTDTMGLPAPQGSPPQGSPKMPSATPAVNGSANGLAPNPNNPNENIKRFEAPSRSLSPLQHALFHNKTRCFV